MSDDDKTKSQPENNKPSLTAATPPFIFALGVLGAFLALVTFVQGSVHNAWAPLMIAAAGLAALGGAAFLIMQLRARLGSIGARKLGNGLAIVLAFAAVVVVPVGGGLSIASSLTNLSHHEASPASALSPSHSATSRSRPNVSPSPRRTPQSPLPSSFTVPLSALAPGDSGDTGQGGSLLLLPDGAPFAYALSTMRIGEAECNCVPPISPQTMTLASVHASTCKSISLIVYAPWASTDPGGEDAVIVVSGDQFLKVTTDFSHQVAHLSAHLSGGAFQISATEISPANDRHQASVYVNGTLTCTTATGR